MSADELVDVLAAIEACGAFRVAMSEQPAEYYLPAWRLMRDALVAHGRRLAEPEIEADYAR